MKDWTAHISAIFFDFDGLLVNTEPLHFEAYQAMLKNNGVHLSWDFPLFVSIAHISSGGLRNYVSSQAPHLTDRKAWNHLYKEKQQEYLTLLKIKNMDWMPGAQKMIEMVQQAGIPHAIVTNSSKQETDIVKKQLPALQDVSHWITREQYNRPKPAPDAYQQAFKSVGHRKHSLTTHVLGFEDTLKGIYALEQANITPVLVCSSAHPQMQKASKYPSLYYAPSLDAFLEKPFVTHSHIV